MQKIFFTSLILIFGLSTQNSIAIDNKPTEKPTEKEWTLLLFLNGHNNLDSYGAFNINQMEEVGSSDDINMVVQWASLDNGKTKRLYVEKDNDANVTSPAVETLDPVDMGDYKKLIEFVEWGVKNYPAKHYMIVVWNHGSGWHKLSRDNISRDISSDDLTGHVITTEQLALAMDESAKIIGHKVDIYGSDACLMAMAEVGSQMQSSVDYMVGSADLEPGEGWPYNTWLNKWAANSKATPAEVSQYLVQEYLKAYDGGIYGTSSVTLSSMNLNYLPQLESSVKALKNSLVELSDADLLVTKAAAEKSLNYYYSDYVDLGVYIDKLVESKSNIKEKLLNDVKEKMKSVVVESGGTGSFSSSQGVAFWLPTDSYYLSSYGDRYSKLKFNKSTDWLEYLKLINK